MESWTAFAASSTHKHTFTFTYKYMQTHPALQQAAIRPMHHVQVTILYAIDSRMYFVRRIFDSISTPFEQLYVQIALSLKLNLLQRYMYLLLFTTHHPDCG